MTKTDAIKNAFKKRIGKVVPGKISLSVGDSLSSNNKTKASVIKAVTKKKYA